MPDKRGSERRERTRHNYTTLRRPGGGRARAAARRTIPYPRTVPSGRVAGRRARSTSKACTTGVALCVWDFAVRLNRCAGLYRVIIRFTLHERHACRLRSRSTAVACTESTVRLLRLGCNVRARVRRAAAVTAGLAMLPRARCGTFEMIRPRDVPLLTGYCTIGATARALLG